MQITLIYCAGGNRRFSDIALAYGFELGARLPGSTVYHPLHFVDQDWRKPDRAGYMAALAQYRPEVATVLDLERAEQLPEVLAWAEEAAQFVQRVVIIPKVFGIIPRLPRKIGGAEVLLGYSVPTNYAGTETPVWEFESWPVHLLGGSPRAQMRLAHYLHVVSADGNYAQKMAARYCQFWAPGNALAKDRYWPRLRETGKPIMHGAPYEAFRRSCENIAAAWAIL